MRKTAITGLALAGGIYIGSIVATSVPTDKLSPVEPPAPAVHIDEEAVLSALKAKGQLVGLTGKVSKTVTQTDNAWYGDKTYRMTAEGTFKLGVNTSDIDISTNGSTVTVKFPHPKIISVSIPFDKAAIEKDVGMLRKDISESELQAMFGKAREGAVEDIERNRQAFDKAEDSVEKIIEQIVTPIDGVRDIEVGFE